MKIRIIKIGGSLLLRPDLIGDFQAWYRRNTQEACLTLLIVGGGEMINAVRGWDALRPGDPASVHWRCVEMLRFSFESIRDAFEAHRVGDRLSGDRLEAIATETHWRDFVENSLPGWFQSEALANEVILLNVPAFYAPAISSDSVLRLPENWQTTTDAIALWLAHQVWVKMRDAVDIQRGEKAPFSVECTLLKSCVPPDDWTLESLVEAEIIDPACLVFADSPIVLNVEKLLT